MNNLEQEEEKEAKHRAKFLYKEQIHKMYDLKSEAQIKEYRLYQRHY